MSPRESARVTEAELQVLEALWKGAPLSIRELAAALYQKSGASQQATVHKLLERLEAKGCVSRDRREFAHSFRARVRREDLIRAELEEVADKLCEGSLAPLLVHLVEKTRLSAAERARIQRLLEEDPRRPERRG